MTTNYKEEFTKLPYGKCYLFKGNSNKLSWLLKDQPNVSVFQGNNLAQISNFITYEPTNYIVYANNVDKCTLPEDSFYIPKPVRIFVCFCLEDDCSDSEKKLYKKYECAYYQLIDYSSAKFDNEESILPLYREAYKDYKELDKKLLQETLKEFTCYPLTYEQLLEDIKSIKLLIDPSYLTVPELIFKLCSSKDFRPVIKLKNLPRNVLESYFTPPFSGFIQLFYSKLNTEYKITSGLFTWYKYFYFKYALQWGYDVDILVLIFFTWVYKSTVQYHKFGKAGLTMFKPGRSKKGAYIIYFSPSVEAIGLLNNL